MRRQMRYILLFAVVLLWSCGTNGQVNKSANTDVTPLSIAIPEIKEVVKTKEEWKAALKSQEYNVLREAGTEPPRTVDLWDNKRRGLYTCAACQLPLFDSSTKYKSGTGWPSFYEPIAKEVVKEDTDYHLGYARTEIRCAQCDGHLGHVFNDGPKPTGLRYCMNSVSMDFIPAEELEDKQ